MPKQGNIAINLSIDAELCQTLKVYAATKPKGWMSRKTQMLWLAELRARGVKVPQKFAVEH